MSPLTVLAGLGALLGVAGLCVVWHFALHADAPAGLGDPDDLVMGEASC